jgi:cell division protein FtsI/penicillin-binding protein 2
MKKKNSTLRNIPFRNYILTVLMFIAVVLITLYLFKWYQVKTEEKISKSYLIENNLVTSAITTFEELNDVLTENSSRLMLYISYRNDKDIYNIESNYKKIFKKYNLQEIFTLFDITNIKQDNKNYKKLINDFLDINVSGYPVVIYYEDGQISSYKKITSSKDLENLIKKYKIEKNSH